MNIQKLEPVWEDERGRVFDLGSYEYVARAKDSVSGDHVHEVSEDIYLMEGTAMLSVAPETVEFTAPAKVTVPAKTYHKLVALTDIIVLAEKI